VASSAGVTLAYDPLGRLYQVTAANGTITRFLYDGDALVAEYNAAGEMTRRYVHWDGADVPVISYATDSLASPSYLHADHQGSIVAISDATGVTQINRYDEYGIPGTGNAGRFQYTGQVWLAELGLYYYKARIYSPTLGRFLQTDPVGYDGGINLYGYVANDPVNRTDPTGLTCRPVQNNTAYDCKVDVQGPLSDRQVARTNAAYTGAVNRLMTHPDRRVTVMVNGRTMSVRAREVARGLIRADVRGGAESATTRADTLGGALTPARGTSDGRPIITIHRNAVPEDRASRMRAVDGDLRRTFIHEGIHTVPQEGPAYTFQYINPSRFDWNNRHVDPYSAAAQRLDDE